MKFKEIDRGEVERINSLQSEYFSKYMHLFDPPLPRGVPERLERIVDLARITATDVVLDVGSGTGILIPIILKYEPSLVYANDLSERMLESVRERYPRVRILQGDMRDLTLSDGSVDVIFLNACYPNIVDKHGSFTNMGRITRPGGRLIISHPMGRDFVDFLQEKVPFPLDEFPESEAEAKDLFAGYGFGVADLVNENDLYILVLKRVKS